MFSFSQNGTILLSELKPLDKIILGKDTGVVLTHSMLKQVNMLIARENLCNEQIDSLRTIIKIERNIILSYREVVESFKRESEIWQDMNEITTKQLLQEKKKVRTWKGLVILAGVIIVVEGIMLGVSAIK
jgi:hypothetical protein